MALAAGLILAATMVGELPPPVSLAGIASTAVYATLTYDTGLNMTKRVEISTSGHRLGKVDPKEDYWIAIQKDSSLGERVYWETDSRKCPALSEVMKTVGELPTITVTPPAEMEREIPFDYPVYEVSVLARSPGSNLNGRVTFQQGAKSPFGDKIEAALDALEPCWTRYETGKTAQ